MLKFALAEFAENQTSQEARETRRLRADASVVFAAALGGAAALLGLAVLAGWIFDIPAIKSIRPDWASMKANTAFGFVLAGCAMCLVQAREPVARVAAVVLAAAAVILGALTLVQYFTGFNFGIDQAIFQTAEATRSPGRPAIITAFNFTVIGLALVMLGSGAISLRPISQLVVIPALALSYLALLGYSLSASSLYQVPGFTTVALHTAIGQFLLSLAMIASSPDAGIMRLLIADGRVGRLSRLLLVTSLVAFPLIGWISDQAETSGVISDEIGTALIISVTVALVLAFILLPLEALLRSEKARRRLSLAIETSKRAENTFRNVLNAAPDGMIITDRSGEIVMANAEAEKLFGYTRDELIGQSIEMLVPTSQRAGHAQKRETFWRSPVTRPMGQGSKLVARRKNGRTVPVEISLSPLRTDGDNLVISSIRDITERTRLFEALHEKNLELERASKAKDHFLASMSHELRTPLTVILGFVKTLKMHVVGPLNVAQDRQVSKIESNATHLMSLLNDLLDLAKLQSDTKVISLEPVDLREVVDEVAGSLRQLAEEKGIALQVKCPTTLLLADSNRLAVTQILINLVNNAIKFTNSGSVRVAVGREASGTRQETHIRVIDTGTGIKTEDHDKLFKPFSRLDTTSVKGTGLGLLISRKLARALGGDIHCKSVYGKGSTFTLILPEEQRSADSDEDASAGKVAA